MPVSLMERRHQVAGRPEHEGAADQELGPSRSHLPRSEEERVNYNNIVEATRPARVGASLTRPHRAVRTSSAVAAPAPAASQTRSRALNVAVRAHGRAAPSPPRRRRSRRSLPPAPRDAPHPSPGASPYARLCTNADVKKCWSLSGPNQGSRRMLLRRVPEREDEHEPAHQATLRCAGRCRRRAARRAGRGRARAARVLPG